MDLYSNANFGVLVRVSRRRRRRNPEVHVRRHVPLGMLRIPMVCAESVLTKHLHQRPLSSMVYVSRRAKRIIHATSRTMQKNPIIRLNSGLTHSLVSEVEPVQLVNLIKVKLCVLSVSTEQRGTLHL